MTGCAEIFSNGMVRGVVLFDHMRFYSSHPNELSELAGLAHSIRY